MSYDIAICFRMCDNETANSMKQWLNNKNYSVSVCSSNFGGGKWRETMRSRIDGCKDCVIIISDGTFKKIPKDNKDDYLIEEILLAKEKGKRIIPVIKDSTHKRYKPYLPRVVEQILSDYNEIRYHSSESERAFSYFMMELINDEEPFLLSLPQCRSASPLCNGYESLIKQNDALRFYKESTGFKQISNQNLKIVPLHPSYK